MIYETDRLKTSAGRIWPRIKQLKAEFNPYIDTWSDFYDPAASWFQIDVFDRFDDPVQPAKSVELKMNVIETLLSQGLKISLK